MLRRGLRGGGTTWLEAIWGHNDRLHLGPVGQEIDNRVRRDQGG